MCSRRVELLLNPPRRRSKGTETALPESAKRESGRETVESGMEDNKRPGNLPSTDAPFAGDGDDAPRESLDHFRAIVDALPAAIYTTDAEGRLTYFNPAAVEFSGHTPELGTDRWHVAWKLYYSDGRPMPRYESPMAIALKEGRAVSGVEVIAERPDGERIWFEPHPSPLRDVDGRIVGGINMLVDISERKQAEAQLHRNERELADFFDNAAVPLHWVGPDGMVLRVNRAELDLLGYTHEEYVGHHIAEFHVDEKAIHDILRRLASAEELHDYEARLRRKDGSIVHVLISSNVMWENGEFIHTRCFTRDITEQKRREYFKALMSAIVESSDDAILSKDFDGVIRTWNPGAERLFGYTAQEAIGQPVQILSPTDRLHEETRILAQVKRNRRVDHFETVRVRKDGTPLDISLTTSPVRDSKGEIIGASTIARDITERKRANERERRMHDEMKAARAEAERSNRGKADFLAIMSHELRTPLNAILGYVELLLLGVPKSVPEESKVQLERVNASAHHLLQLIEGILTFSRIEAGREEIHPESVDLVKLVHETAELVRPLAEAKGLALRVRTPEMTALQTDPGKVRQILLNLLSNAIKFTDEGEVELSAEAENAEVSLQVRDTGLGIPPDQVERIFEPFQQLRQELSREKGGTGLGLSVTRELAVLLGGAVRVESTPGQGSTFTVRLPRRNHLGGDGQ